jgi:uncharacterized membrane protein
MNDIVLQTDNVAMWRYATMILHRSRIGADEFTPHERLDRAGLVAAQTRNVVMWRSATRARRRGLGCGGRCNPAQAEGMSFHGIVEIAAQIMEALGVAIIVGGSVIAAAQAIMRARHLERRACNYQTLRQAIGRAILLGLELLVGADIIRTVSELPTLRNVMVLAVIIIIRTFLSFTLEVELEGRWPWQRGGREHAGETLPTAPADDA